MESKELTRIQVPSKGQIRVVWNDKTENYSVSNKNRIKSHFAHKYGIPSSLVSIEFHAIKLSKDGKEIEVSDGIIENIMDSNYQRQLFQQWLNREGYKIDFERIIKLDDKVNEILATKRDTDTRYRKWFIKKLEFDNFLSYGDGNSVDYKKLEGLTVVTSDPANQGGKTVFSIDALLFLFFNETTRTQKAIEIFNQYRDVNKVRVKGWIDIDGEEYILERTIERKKKKDGEYSTRTDFEVFKTLADGSAENLTGEQRRETDKLINDTLGTPEDFLITIIATASNLESLIETKPTERGKLFTKFIGLEILDEKEGIVKELFSEFKAKMKSNTMNISQLEIDNKNLEDSNTLLEQDIEAKTEQLENVKTDIENTRTIKEGLIGNKHQIDDALLRMNPTTLQAEVEALTTKGISLKKSVENITTRLAEIGAVEYEEQEHKTAEKEDRELTIEKGTNERQIKTLIKLNKDLKDGEVCPTCKRSLDDVDHSDEIKKNEEKIEELNNRNTDIQTRLTELIKILEAHQATKALVDEKNRLEINKGRNEIEMEKLRSSITEKKNQIKEYNKNLDNIEENKKTDAEISKYTLTLKRLEDEKDGYVKKIQSNTDQIKKNKEKVAENLKNISTIQKEQEVQKIFEIYSKMIGKNGIGKIILGSTIPVINAEIFRLLDGVCDFDIELNLNDKNELEFLLIKDDVVKPLISGSGFEKTVASLALRCILGRISTLPKPNILVFDEVTGKVSNDNLDNLKIFFDNIKEMFECILVITHNPIIKDWAKNVITIKKINNVSTLTVK